MSPTCHLRVLKSADLFHAPDLRLQLLEPDKYPYLYKCLYGLLMLLPQSSAFAALKNRLNSVSSVGYLHIAPRPYVSSPVVHQSHSRQGSVADAVSSLQPPVPRSKVIHDTHASASSSVTTPSSSNYDRPNRLGVKGREESIIRWDQLLEKFRSVQDRARRAQRLMNGGTLDDGPDLHGLRLADNAGGDGSKDPTRLAGPPVPQKDPAPQAAPKRSSGLSRQFGRLGGAVSSRTRKSQS